MFSPEEWGDNWKLHCGTQFLPRRLWVSLTWDKGTPRLISTFFLKQQEICGSETWRCTSDMSSNSTLKYSRSSMDHTRCLYCLRTLWLSTVAERSCSTGVHSYCHLHTFHWKSLSLGVVVGLNILYVLSVRVYFDSKLLLLLHILTSIYTSCWNYHLLRCFHNKLLLCLYPSDALWSPPCFPA